MPGAPHEGTSPDGAAAKKTVTFEEADPISRSDTLNLWATLEKALNEQVEPRPDLVSTASPFRSQEEEAEADASFASSIFASIASNFEDITKCFSRKDVGFFDGDETSQAPHQKRRSMFHTSDHLAVGHVPSRNSRRNSSRGSRLAIPATGLSGAEGTDEEAEDGGDEVPDMVKKVPSRKRHSRRLMEEDNMMSIATTTALPSDEGMTGEQSLADHYDLEWSEVVAAPFSDDIGAGAGEDFPSSRRASRKSLAQGGADGGGVTRVDPKERLDLFHGMVDDLPESHRRRVLENFTRQEQQISHLQGVIKVYEEMMHGRASAEETDATTAPRDD